MSKIGGKTAQTNLDERERIKPTLQIHFRVADRQRVSPKYCASQRAENTSERRQRKIERNRHVYCAELGNNRATKLHILTELVLQTRSIAPQRPGH